MIQDKARRQKDYPDMGVSFGLRPCHYQDVLSESPESLKLKWFEVISENFLGFGVHRGGRPLHILNKIRESYEIVFHGVSLNVGSFELLDQSYLKRMKELYDQFQPRWVSDHICWTGIGGQNLHDLLPLPYTEEVLQLLCEKIDFLQNFYKRRMMFENVSSYLTFQSSEYTEWGFVRELAQRTGCGILLDVNNIYVSSRNHGFDPLKYLEAMPKESVGQMHLAGHADYGTHIIDTHDHDIVEDVWKLYEKAIGIFGHVSTLVERDANIPPLWQLMKEVQRAQKIRLFASSDVSRLNSEKKKTRRSVHNAPIG